MACAIGGCDAFKPGRVYDKPFDRAYADLSSMAVNDYFDEGEPGPAGKDTQIVWATVSRGTDAIAWDLNIGTAKIARVTARLTPAGPSQTRVAVEHQPADGGSGNEAKRGPNTILTDFTRIAMTELIDARLHDRVPTAKAIGVRMAVNSMLRPRQAGMVATTIVDGSAAAAIAINNELEQSNRRR